MKKIISVVSALLISFILCNAKSGNEADKTINEISRYIKEGDSYSLGKLFDKSIELSIPGNTGTFSNSQAEMIIKDFFAKYSPTSFSLKNKGKSNAKSVYFIGELDTKKSSFHTFIVLKKNSGKYIIQQLKFEK